MRFEVLPQVLATTEVQTTHTAPPCLLSINNFYVHTKERPLHLGLHVRRSTLPSLETKSSTAGELAAPWPDMVAI